MTNPKDPKPVLIPVLPRFGEDGKPTCRGCAFAYMDWGNDFTPPFRECSISESYGDSEPGHGCPIHNPEALAKLEAL